MEKDRSVWTIKREAHLWDDRKHTSVEGFVLECPFGHPLSVTARPRGATKFPTSLPCSLCLDHEGQQTDWKLPPELSAPAWDSGKD
jgi:hypothetical protein